MPVLTTAWHVARALFTVTGGLCWTFTAIAVVLIVIDVRKGPRLAPRKMTDTEFDQAFRQMIEEVRGAG